MPGAEVVAVVPFRGIARDGAEVREIARCAVCVVLVVTGGRPRSALVSAPGRLVALLKIFERTVGVRVVAEGEDGAGNLIEQNPGGAVADQTTEPDVAGADEGLPSGAFGGVGAKPRLPSEQVAHGIASTERAETGYGEQTSEGLHGSSPMRILYERP